MDYIQGREAARAKELRKENDSWNSALVEPSRPNW